MKLTKEQLLAAKNTKSVEELAALVKELGVEMSTEDLQKTFDAMQKTGELSDNELDNVAGGSCETSNGLTGLDHPDKICPFCGGKGLNEELAWNLRWVFECPNCRTSFREDENGKVISVDTPDPEASNKKFG